MYYELTNTPDSPVSLADAKLFLRIEHDAEDALITSLIASAVDYGEKYTGRDFSVKTWDCYSSDICYGDALPYIELQRAPYVSIQGFNNSVDGSYVDNTNYIIKNKSGYARLLVTGELPNIDTSVAYNYKVSFTSGYSTIPDGIKTAILEHVNFLYENRGDVPSNGIKQIKQLYHQYRIIPIYGI